MTSTSIQHAIAQAQAAADAVTPGQGQIVPFGRPISLMDNLLGSLGRFFELSSEVLAKRGSADEWRKVKDAMTILRALAKQHLVPSFNRVASHLIAGMTGGQRQSIVVDVDFDITVDGQALDTLSGSGKAVANLALRLGLGQVLTNKVFSLFIGDEIDASLDQDRSENCATSLQAVKGWFSQIILISHKSMPADYCIDLGASA